MDAALLTQLINSGISVFLVIGGAIFVATKVYPDWVARDTLQTQRHYETDLKSLQTESLMSEAILALSVAVAGCRFQRRTIPDEETTL